MRILVVGNGARENALIWKLKQSPKVTELYVAPGNAGTSVIARNLAISATDIPGLVKASQELKIELVVFGPEAPLALGGVDDFEKVGIPVFGLNKRAALLETSKIFAHELMEKYDIPCAKGRGFSTFAGAIAYIEKQPMPIVIKADGLAVGKGVVVAFTRPEAEEALRDFILKSKLGEAGERVLVCECLTGKELSAFALTDGKTVVMMKEACVCDYKRLCDGDRGAITGGMGSYSPPEFATQELLQTINETIFVPTVKAMEKENRPFRGLLYGGLMVTDEGPMVLEWNVRFGDPEAQVILPRLKTDLVDILLAVLNGTLDKLDIQFSPDACVGVVMASPGYPDKLKTGFPISGLDKVGPDVLVFHAGTKPGERSGEILTSGGRVLTIVATGKTMLEAQRKVYANVPRIHFEGCQFRGDIADRPIKSGFQLDMKGL